MKKLATNTALSLQPVPKTIVSCRDKEGRNNALVVGFTANVSLDPVMIVVGIVPSRFSHHMVKENGCFVVNLPGKDYQKEYDYLGSHSGRDGDKFAALDLKRGTLKAAFICPGREDLTYLIDTGTRLRNGDIYAFSVRKSLYITNRFCYNVLHSHLFDNAGHLTYG